jgi:hypothetical protein
VTTPKMRAGRRLKRNGPKPSQPKTKPVAASVRPTGIPTMRRPKKATSMRMPRISV